MAALQPPKIYTVSDLTAEIRATLEDSFAGIWVEGELSNFHRHSSGHMYFSLKDEGSQIRVVMFRTANRQLRFQPKDGLVLLVYGELSVYERRGEYQLVAEYMEPKGLGALQLAFEQLKQRLQAEGLFDDARKRPIPLLPRRIGVVTSPTGAAVRDILHVLRRRFAGVDVLIYPVAVQGDQAASEIVEALDELNRRGGLDVVIVARGGGSIEDCRPSTRRASPERSRPPGSRSSQPSVMRSITRLPILWPTFALRHRLRPQSWSLPGRTSSCSGLTTWVRG